MQENKSVFFSEHSVGQTQTVHGIFLKQLHEKAIYNKIL